VVAGRDEAKAKAHGARIGAEGTRIDANDPGLAGVLRAHAARLVISTAGPFQGADYRVARAAIEAGAHYIDIADGRDFVTGIVSLDAAARARGVIAVSGASSVPALTCAVVDRFAGEFHEMTAIDAGISASADVPGAATLAAVLGYAGKPFTRWRDGEWVAVRGWQAQRSHVFPGAHGTRWFGDCDVPDLAILPLRHPSVRCVRFGAGVELAVSHWGLWLLSWGVRAGLIGSARDCEVVLARVASRLRRFGSGRSAMFVKIRGRDAHGREVAREWELLAHEGHGVNIPCMAAVRLARKLAKGEVNVRGAMPCVGLLALDEYLDELRDLRITVR
jgi:hypothetical protein